MKRVLVSLLFCISLISLVGCGSFIHDNMYDSDNALAGSDRYNMVRFSGYDPAPNEYTFTVESISGAFTILQTHEDEPGREINISYTLEGSQVDTAKLVLVDPTGSVTLLSECSSEPESGEHLITTVSGDYQIKLVGKGLSAASGSVSASAGDWDTAE